MKIIALPGRDVIPAEAGIQVTLSFKTPGWRIKSGMTENKRPRSYLEDYFRINVAFVSAAHS